MSYCAEDKIRDSCIRNSFEIFEYFNAGKHKPDFYYLPNVWSETNVAIHDIQDRYKFGKEELVVFTPLNKITFLFSEKFNDLVKVNIYNI